jgi:hypothetical protein
MKDDLTKDGGSFFNNYGPDYSDSKIFIDKKNHSINDYIEDSFAMERKKSKKATFYNQRFLPWALAHETGHAVDCISRSRRSRFKNEEGIAEDFANHYLARYENSEAIARANRIWSAARQIFMIPDYYVAAAGNALPGDTEPPLYDVDHLIEGAYDLGRAIDRELGLPSECTRDMKWIFMCDFLYEEADNFYRKNFQEMLDFKYKTGLSSEEIKSLRSFCKKSNKILLSNQCCKEDAFNKIIEDNSFIRDQILLRSNIQSRWEQPKAVARAVHKLMAEDAFKDHPGAQRIARLYLEGIALFYPELAATFPKPAGLNDNQPQTGQQPVRRPAQRPQP